VQAAPQQRGQRILPAGHRRIVFDRNVQRGIQIRRRRRFGACAGQRGTDGRVEWRGDDVRRVSHGPDVRGRRLSGGGVLRGGVRRAYRDRRALRRQQLDGGTGQRTVTDERGASRRRDSQDLVDDVGGTFGGSGAEPRVADPLQCVEVGL
jgi:hypothetical protein